MRFSTKFAVAACSSVLFAASAHAADITGAGATFPAPIYAKWADAYQKATGNRVNYQSIGSGGGIRQIGAKTVDFGASDMPLTPEKLAEGGLQQFPTVIGAVVPVVNLEGIKPGDMKLTGEVLAGIYHGKITKWNDPAIVALNPDLKLSDQDIGVVRRADGSGTTFVFTNYLSKVSTEWKEKIGEGTAVQWPVGLGGKGNEGVSAFVQRLPGSIGYVEYAYAKQNKLSHAIMQNKEGPVRRAERRVLRRGRRGCRLVQVRVLRDPDQRAGCEVVADHQRHLHPDAQDAGQAGAGRRGAEVLRLGVRERR
jgi:phosphate transport system substrate-binding protein